MSSNLLRNLTARQEVNGVNYEYRQIMDWRWNDEMEMGNQIRYIAEKVDRFFLEESGELAPDREWELHSWVYYG